MPSDPRVAAAVAAIDPALTSFRALLATAADRLDALVEQAPASNGQPRSASELGVFADGRIDASRFDALSVARTALDAHETALLRRAREVLRDAAGLPAARFVVDVPSGGRLGSALAHVFAELGAAFGAIVLAELVRTRRFDPSQHAGLLHSLPRHQWNRAERAAAPPVVVTVDGADLWAGELAQYVDSAQKLILVLRGPVPPAPLVRLITPGVWVQQTSSVSDLREALASECPAVLALMPDGSGAAEFVHRPDQRRTQHERLTVSRMPAAGRRTLPGWSTWQQQEEVAQLTGLAAAPVASTTPAAEASPQPDPADQLARWLLSHADLASAGA